MGTAQTGAGPGTNPFFLPGKVYLTGPYKGAPFGLVVVVPAVAGPLDLGTVVVRQTLNIDPTDAHVTVVSDPFPTILQGIPLRLRRVDVLLNRSHFTVAPDVMQRFAGHGDADVGIGHSRSRWPRASRSAAARAWASARS